MIFWQPCLVASSLSVRACILWQEKITNVRDKLQQPCLMRFIHVDAGVHLLTKMSKETVVVQPTPMSGNIWSHRPSRNATRYSTSSTPLHTYPSLHPPGSWTPLAMNSTSFSSRWCVTLGMPAHASNALQPMPWPILDMGCDLCCRGALPKSS